MAASGGTWTKRGKFTPAGETWNTDPGKAAYQMTREEFVNRSGGLVRGLTGLKAPADATTASLEAAEKAARDAVFSARLEHVGTSNGASRAGLSKAKRAILDRYDRASAAAAAHDRATRAERQAALGKAAVERAISQGRKVPRRVRQSYGL